MNNKFIEFWKKTKFYGDTQILDVDYEILKTNNLLISKEEYIDSIRKSGFATVQKSKQGIKIHRDLPPEPFVGDLLNAKAYIISLNPGCAEHEYNSEYGWGWKNLVDIAEQNRKQEFDKSICKFYYLDDVLANTGGGKYWINDKIGERTQHKLKGLVEKLATTKHLTFNQAKSILSDSLCDIELCPYHSCRWGINPETLKQLPSIQQCLDFIKNTIVPEVLKGNKSLIILRHVKNICDFIDESGFVFVYNNQKYKFSELDTLGLPNVCFYRTPGEAQSASLNPDKRAGAVIFDAIK
ncbi:MAG: hypothetical protein IJQ55_00080 [Alphaproteobacteria bacterium]|nr:hypothetical protein [Alphaproteobacteria bacterium]